MAIQNAVEVDIQYIPETTWGVTPGTPQMIQMRRVSSSLNLQKDTFESNEARIDRNIAGFRHGVKRVGGDLVTELSQQSFDDFIEATLGGTWDTEVSKSDSDFTSMAATNGSSVFTAGSSTWAAEGFVVGDVMTFANLSEAGNNAVRYTIVTLAGAVATVVPAPTTMSADSSFTVVRNGRKCLVGTTKRSFTIEQQYPGVTQYQVFTGCRMNTMAWSMPPTGMVGVTFGTIGKDMAALTGSALDATPTAANTNELLAALNGSLAIGTAAVAVVTGFDSSAVLSAERSM